MIEWALVASPFQFPGYCIDGSQGGPNEGVIDTHVEFDGRRVYLPVNMFKQTARGQFGMVDQAVALTLEERAATAEARVRELETELAEAAPILSAIATASARYGVDA